MSWITAENAALWDFISLFFNSFSSKRSVWCGLTTAGNCSSGSRSPLMPGVHYPEIAVVMHPVIEISVTTYILSPRKVSFDSFLQCWRICSCFIKKKKEKKKRQRGFDLPKSLDVCVTPQHLNRAIALGVKQLARQCRSACCSIPTGSSPPLPFGRTG